MRTLDWNIPEDTRLIMVPARYQPEVSGDRAGFGGSACESNTPLLQKARPPVLKTGRITGSQALPRLGEWKFPH